MKHLLWSALYMTSPLAILAGGGSSPKGGSGSGASFNTYIPPKNDRTQPNAGDEYTKDLLKWFLKVDGRLNRKIDLRRTDPSDPTSPFGLFAMEDVYGKELIMSVPRKTFLTAENIEEGTELIESALPCETAFHLIEEMEKGNSSEFSGYVQFLKHQTTTLPSAWSDTGKELLHKVIEELPPDDATTWIEHEWYEECKGEKDVDKENAALMLISRGWDYVMIPMLDVMNHRNGNYYNTYSDKINDNSKDVLQVRAQRRIMVGEQIFTSYNMCDDCDARKQNYGTPEILRDYGFVEDYPQRWIFDDILQFEIQDTSEIWEEDETKIHRLKEATTDDLELVWLGNEEKGPEDKEFLEVELERLMNLKQAEFEQAKLSVPKMELDIIVQYHDALTNALSMAIDSLPNFEDESSGEVQEEL